MLLDKDVSNRVFRTCSLIQDELNSGPDKELTYSVKAYRIECLTMGLWPFCRTATDILRELYLALLESQSGGGPVG